MITEHDLQEAIAECEGQLHPTSSTCMKLAAFYTIKDKMFPAGDAPAEVPGYSMAQAPVFNGAAERVSDSEFARAIDGMDMGILIPVMDELMQTLRVVCPRLYAGVMRKLSDHN